MRGKEVIDYIESRVDVKIIFKDEFDCPYVLSLDNYTYDESVRFIYSGNRWITINKYRDIGPSNMVCFLDRREDELYLFHENNIGEFTKEELNKVITLMTSSFHYKFKGTPKSEVQKSPGWQPDEARDDVMEITRKMF